MQIGQDVELFMLFYYPFVSCGLGLVVGFLWPVRKIHAANKVISFVSIPYSFLFVLFYGFYIFSPSTNDSMGGILLLFVLLGGFMITIPLTIHGCWVLGRIAKGFLFMLLGFTKNIE